MKYQPQPLDTSAIVLPKSLQGLLEQLAENTHDVWAATRVGQAGATAQPVMTPRNPTRASSPMANCQSTRKNTTARRRQKPSRRS